ncbi:MAG: YeiH family protein [Pseudoalteromonas sp.]|uniref:YeiH family protein n=1 Tax=unclassified Pseudoalteromonas TaxID=194690 RepID=UPI000C077CED|nr:MULTISPECIES: putative sulfate exporter family transporter [unclassified Pseudoalteromonas]MDP2634649.1 putative sulfate exporter family transporter [Pseudoalteromonas sp. 1_MG-2023]PHN91185.1 putative sulfate exporter family transporter [Pseudoalteromonas sp. 3D05]
MPVKSNLIKLSYLILVGLCITPLIGPGVALVFGAAFAIILGNPYAEFSQSASKWLLKAAVIGLGFAVDFNQVIEVGRSSIVLTIVSITAIIGLGEILTQVFKLSRNTGVLISFGTAICGGSAIAAMAPVIKAKDHEVAVALGVVFLLNGVGLLLFPTIGHYLNLSQEQFGLWAALAIHDTSSVVGASATYGAVALSIATTVKLTRAMWIIPYTTMAGVFWRSEEKASIPLFIVGFLAAALINTYLPDYSSIWSTLNSVAKQVLVVTLFLIGSGLSLSVLRQAGVKPFIMATVLWIIVSGVILLLILDGFI